MENTFKVGDKVKLIDPRVKKEIGYDVFGHRTEKIGMEFIVNYIGSHYYNPNDYMLLEIDEKDRPVILIIKNNNSTEHVLSCWITKTSGNNDIYFYGKYL